jgi:uncharacterized protein
MKISKITVLVFVLLLAGCVGTQQGGPQDDTQASEGGTAGSESAPRTEGKALEATSGGSQGSSNLTDPGLSTVVIDASNGEKVEVRVEIADNPISRYLGLRGRENLPVNRGMLFVYSKEQQLSFTMEDTPTPLSIAFIDSKRRIIGIQDMKPLDDEPPGYDSPEPAQYALEVNRGFFDQRGVKVGDKAKLP